MQLPEYKRKQVTVLSRRLLRRDAFMQVLVGPRQVGKTTAVHQVLQDWKGESVYGSADAPTPPVFLKA